jgi:hypothetical protein
VFAFQEAQIANELKTIDEYGCSNQLQEFQITSWPKVDPLFHNEYPWHPNGNLNINWVKEANLG